MSKKLMMMAAAAAAAFGAWAETWTDPDTGYTWTYRIGGDTAEIYKRSWSPAISPSPTGAVTIPSSLGGKPVTSIGSCAFYICSGLTSVTIPNSVTSIGSKAFSECSGLTSVTIPDSVTSIGRDAFYNCGGLTSVTIPNSVTNIGARAFYQCSGLTSVTIPNSVTSIGERAFYGCSGLTSVTIPDSVTNIGDSAFYNCSGLTSVTIPASLTNIGDRTFYNCNGLMSVLVADDNPNYKSINGLLLSKDGTTLIQGINMDVAIPGSVTNIGNYAFYNCGGLTSVTIPDSVTSIGSSAFSGCSGLTSVTIPDSVSSLPFSAFNGCGRLWTAWYRTLANSSASGSGSSGGGSASVVTTVVQQVAAPYALTDSPADRAIASVTVDGDCAIDSFVLKDGEVYDSVLYVSNIADRAVTLTLPTGYAYKTYKGTKPLVIPAKSQCMLSITRVADRTFLVSREELEDVQ